MFQNLGTAMKHRHLITGLVAALATMASVVALILAGGGKIFSPGQLNSQSRKNVSLGGVISHAETGGNCATCHAPPWSSESMADRCLVCHANVKTQLDTQQPLHGKLSAARQCRTCHTEHQGSHAVLTSLDRFDHDLAAFKLTGRHLKVDCQSCHVANVYRGTPQTCASCHAEPKMHKGPYGTACAQCHSTTAWTGAVFKHTFPLQHGQRRKQNTCATCHPAAPDYRTYTCYNCHEHKPQQMERRHANRNIVNLQNCASCHPTGREHEHRKGKHK
jgi:hypothetical protein